LINDKKCDVIVLACTAIEGVYSEMIKRLGVPVIDASIAAFKFAEMMASLNNKTGLRVSKLLTYAN
jgi:allantoin racemase